jgi:DNA polymerase-4
MGLDEAYADLSGLERPLPLLRGVIADVLAKTGIQISAGIGPNKLVAKIASDLDKPAGFVAIGREDAAARLTSKSVRIIPGIGPKTAARLASIGAPTVGDLQRLPEELLAGHFGRRRGQELHMRALLHDDSPVVTEREAKSRSTETTFDQDVTDGTELERVLLSMAGKLAEGLERSATRAKTVGIKVRLDDWTTVTRVRTLPSPTDHAGLIGTTALQLLSEYGPSRPVRLVGVKVASLCSMSAAKASAGDRAAVPAGQLVLEL